MSADRICNTMRALFAEGKFADAALAGEKLALAAHGENMTPTYFGLLAAAHLATGSFAAARLAIVRGNGELNDKTLDFAARVLQARESGKIADAIGALKQAPSQVVADAFRDVLVCELAATVAVLQEPAVIGDLCQQTGLAPEEVKGCLQRAGTSFGVVAGDKGDLTRVAVRSRTAAGAVAADGAAAAAASGAPAASAKSSIASVDLVTQAALMAAQPIDRSWNQK